MICEKNKHLKKTEYKIALLLEKNSLLSARELQNLLKIDKATIYRNIKNLLKKNIIREIKNSNGVSFYELSCKVHFPIHPHFECNLCKKYFV